MLKKRHPFYIKSVFLTYHFNYYKVKNSGKYF